METKAQKEAKRKEKMRKLGRTEQDEKRKNQSVQHLNKEDFLQLRVNMLEKEKITLEISNIASKIDSMEKQIFILRQQLHEKKARERKHIGIHEEFIADLKKRTGIDIRGKNIDFETLEVQDIS